MLGAALREGGYQQQGKHGRNATDTDLEGGSSQVSRLEASCKGAALAGGGGLSARNPDIIGVWR